MTKGDLLALAGDDSETCLPQLSQDIACRYEPFVCSVCYAHTSMTSDI
jgi:hypothetical protein